MKFPRRGFLHLATGALLPALPRIARPIDYPTRLVRIIVGYPPGGPSDIVARLIAQSLSERLNQSFIIENRPGAAGNVGTEAVVRAAADGYTLLLVGAPHAINATVYDNLNFNFIRVIALVASLIGVLLVMEVNPSVAARTVPEFIAFAKGNPGKLTKYGIARRWNSATCFRRTVQDDGRHRPIPRALPRIGASTNRSAQRDRCKSCLILRPRQLGISGPVESARWR